MSTSAQLWLATAAAVVSLLAAAIPASIQLLDDPLAPQPVAAPVAAPPPPATTVTQPATAARDGDRDRNDRRGRGG